MKIRVGVAAHLYLRVDKVNTMPERWKEVVGYEGLYEVSNRGNVRSFCRTPKGKILKPGTDTKGYYFVNLYKDKKANTQRVHRLVLAAFVGEHPDGKPECCHNNGVRTDNRLENLRYGSRQDNVDDTVVHGTKVYGERVGSVQLTAANVLQIRKDYATKKFSQQELADRYGVERKTITFVVRGETWKHIGGPITKMTPGSRGVDRKYLTEEIAQDIKTRYAAGGISQADLAREHGIAQTTVSALVRNKIEQWQHLKP